MIGLLSILLFAQPMPLSEEQIIKSVYFSQDIGSLPIADIKNPTLEDYRLIQHLLDQRIPTDLPKSLSPLFLSNATHIHYRLRGKLILDDTPPLFETIYFNDDPANKEKCVICFAGPSDVWDRQYHLGIDALIKALRAIHFDGHFIYRLGGWPSLQNDRLLFADVPYAFKPFFFEEIQALGYKKILWLDACAIPVKSLDPLFSHMETHGCCFFDIYCQPFSPQQLRAKQYILRAMNLPLHKKYHDAISQVVGLNLDHPQGSLLLDRWIQAAEAKIPFLESDQTPFALLVSDLSLLNGRLPHDFYLEGERWDYSAPRRHPNAIIFHQYDFLFPGTPVPDDFFNY